MTTDQEDAAMLLELQEKITDRIRGQIRLMIDSAYGTLSTPQPYNASLLDPGVMNNALMQNIRQQLLNDSYFITELTKRIGQKMTTLPY